MSSIKLKYLSILCDEYSLEDCIFPSKKEIETYRDVSISDKLKDEQRNEVKE